MNLIRHIEHFALMAVLIFNDMLYKFSPLFNNSKCVAKFSSFSDSFTHFMRNNSFYI